ncbi:MAG: hypothetical protein BGO26_06685 [Actinobacteria bacterium 69-20]|nr:hypothetical protein [Actinomycetota bacterium]OJV28121.1 MAG: hypothetical protein BGO26_06685 [Actinobacteria bacterium 69-20]
MISPAQRYETAAVNALSAALWSSKDADRMFAIVLPRDFHPVDDTIAAAMLDLRGRNVTWADPMPVTDSLHTWRQRWKDRVDSGRFGLPTIETPIADLLDPDRWPLRFASRPLITGRVYDIQIHIADVDIDIAARQIAAVRRHEVAEATMQTVHEILVTPPPGSTRAQRQEAVTRVMHDYRRDMSANHLYPRRPDAAAKTAFDLHR